MICGMVKTAPLLGGVSTLLGIKKFLLALLLALLSDRYKALLCPASTILLAWYVTTASGCAAAYSRNCLIFLIVFFVGLAYCVVSVPSQGSIEVSTHLAW